MSSKAALALQALRNARFQLDQERAIPRFAVPTRMGSPKLPAPRIPLLQPFEELTVYHRQVRDFRRANLLPFSSGDPE